MENNIVSPPEGFKDRSTGLIIFGVLQIVIGAICVLFIPTMVAGQVMAAKATGNPPNFRMIVPGVVTYLMLAATFISIGIGSIKARRWSRALSLILGWAWLIVGIFAIAVSSFVLFQALAATSQAQGTPQAAIMITMVVVAAIFSVMFIILPGGLVLFYGRKDVKWTCETRDPIERWTDRAPLPVLALALMLGFGAVSMLLMPVANNGVLPMFGKLISGIPGTLLTLVFAGVWAWCGWTIYKLNPIGWWIILIAVLVFGSSAFITFRTIDIGELYRTMGYPTEQIEQMEKFSFGGNFISAIMAAGMVPFIGFLLWVKTYLPKRNETTA
jgi:hypothetical protein